MRSRSSEIGVKEYILCFIVILAICFGFKACQTSVEQGNWHEEVVTVCSKEVVPVGNGDSRSHEYRVYTSGESYVVKDYYGLMVRASIARTYTPESRSERPTRSSLSATAFPRYHLSGT